MVMTRATSSFARLLRYYRLAAGLTQEELAERARLSARAISDLERGLKAMPHRHTVELLAEALELPIEDLERAVPRRRGPRSSRDRAPLPVPPTSFVGRDAEIRAVTTLLRQPETRFVTVIGPPGIGKTRLVLAVAETMAEEFADGVDVRSAGSDPRHFLRACINCSSARRSRIRRQFCRTTTARSPQDKTGAFGRRQLRACAGRRISFGAHPGYVPESDVAG